MFIEELLEVLNKNLKEELSKNGIHKKLAKYEVVYHLEGDIKLKISAENEDESLRKAYDMLSSMSFHQLDADGLDYKCIKNDLI